MCSVISCTYVDNQSIIFFCIFWYSNGCRIRVCTFDINAFIFFRLLVSISLKVLFPVYAYIVAVRIRCLCVEGKLLPGRCLKVKAFFYCQGRHMVCILVFGCNTPVRTSSKLMLDISHKAPVRAYGFLLQRVIVLCCLIPVLQLIRTICYFRVPSCVAAVCHKVL